VGVTKGICTLCRRRTRDWGNRTQAIGRLELHSVETIHDLVESIIEDGPECGLILGSLVLESLEAFFNARELRKSFECSSQHRWINDNGAGVRREARQGPFGGHACQWLDEWCRRLLFSWHGKARMRREQRFSVWGDISNDQIVPEAGLKTLVGYREMDEEPIKRRIFQRNRWRCEDLKI